MQGMLGQLRQMIPKLTPQLHKGQCGRLAVIGGCGDYTGAPYFSAIAAMALGCDLVHVITTGGPDGAAGVIKGYSPDLMVHPYLREGGGSDLDKCMGLLERMDAVVVGPGMGRDGGMRDDVGLLLEQVLSLNTPVVMDADALFHLSVNEHWRAMVSKSNNVVLTPNVVEYKRLADAVSAESLEELARTLNCVVFQKGTADKICVKGASAITVETAGSLKRVGGQGDTLTGVLGTLLSWGAHAENVHKDEMLAVACVGASHLTRDSCRRAYETHGRAMLTSSIHHSIGEAFDTFYNKD